MLAAWFDACEWSALTKKQHKELRSFFIANADQRLFQLSSQEGKYTTPLLGSLSALKMPYSHCIDNKYYNTHYWYRGEDYQGPYTLSKLTGCISLAQLHAKFRSNFTDFEKACFVTELSWVIHCQLFDHGRLEKLLESL